MALELWHAWACPYCMRVRAALAEKGVPWRSREIELNDKPEEFLQLSRTGGVPLLVDDGNPLPESLAILELLDRRYPEPALFPEQPGHEAVRALYERVNQLLASLIPAIVRGQGETRLKALDEARRAFIELDLLVGDGEYLAGRFSAADLALASFVAKLPPDARPSALGFRNLARWERAVLLRPAVRQEMGPKLPAQA
ncbi:MAG TPA: glutathione S-transferase family protein [Anaeromyxobacteraceae bacterium]|jgi:glutathione S-transferase|nr:glutathione S-transferase family protein [Anaeromyxobacteraceae bacterium]